MIPNLLLFLLLLVSAGLAVSLRQQHKMIAGLRKASDELRGEEDRAFQFLHNLGSAVQEDYSASNMHRCIVEGIIQALEANGAALYLLDESKSELVPKFISNNCPPLVLLPEDVIKERETKPSAISNYVRLQTIDSAHPIYSRPMETLKPLRIDNLALHPDFGSSAIPEIHNGVSLIIGPLIYAGKPMGLLMIARKLPAEPFSENETELFRSLAEQSAYALGSSEIHKEAHDKRLLDGELRTASEFQRILLPSSAPDVADFDIAGVNFPAKVVSGDYFDYIKVDENHLGIVIADVAGKGLPASLIMATCRSVLRARAFDTLSPAEVLRTVNRQIFTDIREDMFVTLAYLIFDGESDKVTMARAGHNPPFIYRGESKEVEALEPAGMALGIDSGGVFDRIISDFEFEFRKGDALLLYTDGVTEAENSQTEEYSPERMTKVLKNFANHTSEAIISRLNDELRAFVGNAPQSDDITLIAVKKG
ncbi:MAG: GAF domain-containing SpoIIE family protein phosphatase [Verrucomicrobiota bacterium]